MTPHFVHPFRPKAATFSKRILLHVLILFFLFILSSSGAFAQARLVLNGAYINISQGATLVIDNPAANAITRNSGHIISEGESNIIKWNIGTTTGNYVVPFGYSNTNYIPVSFTPSASTGSGSIQFSTYHTGWQNSTQLPSGVTNMNGSSGLDYSAYVLDRFWQINAQGYTTKPTLTNLIFTYLDIEHSVANNTITEGGLVAHRWNNTLSSWIDNAPASTINTGANTVSIASLTPSNFYNWWNLTYVSDRHWVASAPANWNNAANWSTTAGGAGGAGVPSATDAVFFDAAKVTNCTINANITIGNLVVGSGYTGNISQGNRTLTVNSIATFSGGTFSGGTANITVGGPFTVSGTTFTSTSGILDLKDNFTFNSGTFAHNNGTVRFSGTTATQNIGGTSVTNFNNVSMTNTAANPGASIQSNQNLNGILTLANNVVFDADGSSNNAVFTLISSNDNPTKDAAIAILPAGAQVTGKVTVQRYMAIEGGNSTRIYRYISSPLQNAAVSDIQNEIPVTGSFTGTSVCSGCGKAQSMFGYTESVITDTNKNGVANYNDGYVDFPNASNTETLTPGKGYAMFVRGNTIGSALWDVRGTINSGNVTPVTFPVTYTSSGTLANDGWNLVGNPYPSTMDWNAASGWTKTNLTASIYMLDNGKISPQYATWNGVTGTNGGSRYIAMGQGFWVKANGAGAPVLRANENVKAAGTQTTFFRASSLENILRITMVQGSDRDETVIHFRDDATEGFDDGADALKLPNNALNIASLLTDGTELAINSLSTFNCGHDVNLTIEKPAVGNYSLEFSQFESFADNVTITLIDNFTNTSFDIRSGSYNFSVTSAPASYGSDRFKINFATTPINSDFIVSTTDVCVGSDATVKIDNTQSGAEYVLLLNDTLALTTLAGNGGTINFTIPKDSLVTGQDTISVKASMPSCSTIILKKIAMKVEKIYSITSTEPGKNCRTGAVTLTAIGAPENGSYNWYESESSTTPIVEQHTSSFTTPSLVKSKTYYVSAVNSLGCEGPRSSGLAEVVQFEDAIIVASGDTLQTNYTTGIQWFFNHEPITGDTLQLIKVDKSGTYSVEVSINGCTTSADHEFVITGIEKPNELTVTVYPNPVASELHIEVPDRFKSIREVRMLNSLGEFITPIKLQQENGKRTGKIEMTNYPAGIYIIQGVGNIGKSEVKVIKQ